MMNLQQLNDWLAHFPRVELITQATPLQQLAKHQSYFGLRQAVWLKRDDLNEIGPGGNKVRNLEFILADALQKGCDTLIASGEKQSNLCTIAAAAANRLGLRIYLVHNSVSSENRRGNDLLNQLLDTRQVYLGPVTVDARNRAVTELAVQLSRQGRKPYIIENGASTAVGSLGYVRFVSELLEDADRRNIVFSDLFIPAGNGGLATGVVFGLAMLEFPLRPQLISVEYDRATLIEIVTQQLHELAALTAQNLPADWQDQVGFYDDYRGKGWNQPTAEADQMVLDMARLEGIFCERVYTAKTFYGATDLLKRGEVKPQAEVCLLHSGGFSALFDQFA